MGEFDPGDRRRGIGECLETSHRGASAFDCAMVLLDDVVQAAVGSSPDVAPAAMLAPKQPQRATTRDMTIECDLPRHAWSDCAERFA
jgi:hypothetical protein